MRTRRVRVADGSNGAVLFAITLRVISLNVVAFAVVRTVRHVVVALLVLLAFGLGTIFAFFLFHRNGVLDLARLRLQFVDDAQILVILHYAGRSRVISLL